MPYAAVFGCFHIVNCAFPSALPQRLHKFAKFAGEPVFPNFDESVEQVLEAAAAQKDGCALPSFA